MPAMLDLHFSFSHPHLRPGLPLLIAVTLLSLGCVPFDDEPSTPRARGTVVVVSMATTPTLTASIGAPLATPTSSVAGERFRLELVTPQSGAAPAIVATRTPTANLRGGT